MARDLQATHKRVVERNEAEAQQAQRRAAEAAAVNEDVLAADLAADVDDDPAANEAQLKAIQQQVEIALQEDAETVGPEPPTHVTIINPTQALPALQLQGLPVLQPLLALPQQLLGAEAGSSSSSSSEAAEAGAAEAFAWLLGQRQQLLVCPDAATAKAVFQAVWCSSSTELAKAAYTTFLGWCAMSESQSGGDVADVSDAPWFSADSSCRGDTSLLCGAPAFADQQPPVTLHSNSSRSSFPPAARRQQARSNPPAAAAADTDLGSAGSQEGSYADANLPLLLSLLRHLCRLGVQGRVQVKLGGGHAPKQLALLLMALMLDPRAGGSAAGRGLLQDALASLLALASDVEWRRLQGQLLEALAPPGIGPSRRQGACALGLGGWDAAGALQLLGNLLPSKKKQQLKARAPHADWPAVHRELFLLLGAHPDKALSQGLARPTSSAGGSKTPRKHPAGAVDIWALLDVLDAADLLLWSDLVRPEYMGAASGGVSGEARAWFGSWMEKLERQIGKELKFYRLRSRLTELRNAYEFGSALGAAFGGGGSDSGNE
ncbi:hypothetical protein COO60DRAFT_1644676 [Scenedesmus sp. NREL 46B-D3]|nr:hypothetical protein COO60DRAFT_1644676 [Scenedesmus sp. NREL 46B-D3]